MGIPKVMYIERNVAVICNASCCLSWGISTLIDPNPYYNNTKPMAFSPTFLIKTPYGKS